MKDYGLVIGLALISILTATCALSSPAPTGPSRVRFAVIARQLSGKCELRYPGIAIGFDLEKRLERWSALEDTDRLRLRRIVDQSSPRGEKAVARAVLQELNADAVIALGGSCGKDRLRLEVRLFTKPTSPARSFVAEGSPRELFAFEDRLVDRVVEALRTLYPRLPAPTDPARFKLHPACSVSAYDALIRGKVALDGGDPAAARSFLLRALELDPGQWWARYLLGAVEFQQGHFADAIKWCREALALDADLYPAIYANMSYCYTGIGDARQADYCQAEFERRTGKRLPPRALPTVMP